jgi:predicted HTH transcriptional regulator
MPEFSDKELIERILSIPAEDRTKEFKRLGKDLSVRKVIDSIVALANTDGGFIILGVDDPPCILYIPLFTGCSQVSSNKYNKGNRMG